MVVLGGYFKDDTSLVSCDVGHFIYYVNNNMSSVVEITFVDKSQNFDFEKNGK